MMKKIVWVFVLLVSFVYAQSFNPFYTQKEVSGEHIFEKEKHIQESQEKLTPEVEKYKHTYAQKISVERKGVIKTEKPSVIELKFSKTYPERVKGLKQFGYDIFKNIKPVLEIAVPVGDDYVLGPGDEVVIYFWGDPVEILKLDSIFKTYVDREGKVFIPYAGVIYAWGKTIKEFREELIKLLSKKFKRFKVEVSAGKIRTFTVYVSGYVNKPGAVLVNSTFTVLEALALAGGVSKNGSLRKIYLRRNDKEIYEIDLYDLLVKGKKLDIRLKDGDVIFVEKIGKTVAIAGSVKRPGIYELKNEKTIKDLINLAGGTLFSAYNYGIKLFRYEENTLKVFNGNLFDEKFVNTELKDGDLVFIEDIYELPENYIEVKGHVKYTGKYSVNDYKTLRELIETVELLPDTNLYYAEIVRKDIETGKTQIINFVPKYVLEGRENYELKPFDVVIFYPEWLYTPITVSGEVENPQVIPYYPKITLLDVLREIKLKDDYTRLKALVYLGKPVKVKKKEEKKEEIVETAEKLIEEGEKTRVVYLYDLFVKGIGNVVLTPGTKILIKRTEKTEKDKTVTILGEVKRPGIYKLEKGMRLYDLIKKAGGYTENAYPKGLIFIRESAKKLQEEHLKIAITALEEGLLRSEEGTSLAGASPEERAILQMTINRQKQLLRIIKEKAKIGLGRIALDIPDTLEELKNSSSNILLEDGDYIYVPSKPNYVLVLGAVYNQISLPYIKGKPVSYYLKLVGGTTPEADIENIYIIKANGRVISKRNVEKFLSFDWKDGKLYFARDFMDMPVEQGDTIVVPAKLKVPVMWRPLLRDVVQIIFQSISTAVLAKRL